MRCMIFLLTYNYYPWHVEPYSRYRAQSHQGKTFWTAVLLESMRQPTLTTVGVAAVASEFSIGIGIGISISIGTPILSYCSARDLDYAKSTMKD